MKHTTEYLKEYTLKSRDPKYPGYNPLQCATYDGDEEAVSALIEYYRVKKTLSLELSYISPQAKTHENILHLAIKHPRLCDLFCQAISKSNPDLLTLHINQGNIDKDTVFHQAAEFGNYESLKILMKYVRTLVADIDLEAAFKIKNKYRETASDIAEHYDISTTIDHLKTRGTLTIEKLSIAHRNLREIQGIFSEQCAPRRSYSH